MDNQPEIHMKSRSEQVEERKEAAEAIRYNFANLPNKEQAWDDLLHLTADDDSVVRWRASEAFEAVFSHVPDKEQALDDLLRLTTDDDSVVRWHAAQAFGVAFSHVPDKEQAWHDLHRLTSDKDRDVRKAAAEALGAAFSQAPNKNQAWDDLHRLASDKDGGVRKVTANALGVAFSYVPDKEQAWDDLHKLTADEDCVVRWCVAEVLYTVFSHLPNKKQAWDDLLRLTADDNRDVRWCAAEVLGVTFSHAPDKKQSWDDLYRLTTNNHSGVRWRAAEALGDAFSHLPNKEQAYDDLLRLASNDDSGVRVYANHSLGRYSVFKATLAESDYEFRKELEKALQFFEKASQEAEFFNPANFCLPFYRSFHAITFKKQEEVDVDKYLSEARSAVEGSESKEKLLKAVENLSNALKEAHKARTLDEKKCDLNVFRKYYEIAAELLKSVGDKAPWDADAAAVVRGVPIIDERIKGIIGEIREKTKEICKTARGTGTPYESLGKEVNQLAGTLSEKDHLKSEKSVSRITNILGEFCKLLPEDKRGHACEIIKEINEEEELVERLSKVELALTYLQPNIEKELHEKDKIKEANEKEKRINIPFEYDLISVINDSFSPIKQKEVKKGSNDAESKTLEFLRTHLHELIAKGREIHWLDFGCGNGRSLDVLNKITKNQDKINYKGTDCSDEHFNEARKRANDFKINASFKVVNAASMNSKSQYDVVSAILFLHEVDPLCLPCVLRNMLCAIKKDGTIVVSDFEKPFEQERDTVTWNSTDIETLLSNFSEVGISFDKKQAEQFPEELEFYQCYIKNPNVDEEKFTKFIQHGFENFLENKKNDSIQKCEELESQITKRVCDILKRPYSDIDAPSDEEMKQVTKNIDANYGIKAHKVVMLTRQIKFLDKKIKELKNGDRCSDAK